MSLQSLTLSTTTANIYTSSGETVVTPIYLCNYSGSTVTCNVFAVSSGGTASTTNMIYTSLQITAGDTYVIDKEKLILGNGDFLAANCSANTSLSATVSYSSI
jgi:hypothetical protein